MRRAPHCLAAASHCQAWPLASHDAVVACKDSQLCVALCGDCVVAKVCAPHAV